jgi:uncharacterized protein YyaL (SSP411 family)
MANRLADEKSPYLLQHADNPVDWHPWGEEALALAVAEDKPIFLSVGYATCHWCHVMAHESFEDPEVAALLNRHFVPIKVDREERPDLDEVYMSVCNALTGRGGWPLSVFLTPETKPFYAGTYFPKQTRGGMPGFIPVLTELSKRWNSPERERMVQAAEDITRSLTPQPDPAGSLGQADLQAAQQMLASGFDSQWGGFGQAPKFPSPHQLTFLLRHYLREGDDRSLAMVEQTLSAMRDGGMFDQVGFGFHRYSVDQQWLVPHFEKMLYDQATLAVAFLETYQATGKERYANAAREIFTYVLRDMTSPEGAFYSAEDADSEGEEGLFYVWRPLEVAEVLGGELGGLFSQFYGLSEQGNFEHNTSIPHRRVELADFARAKGMEPAELAERLEEARIKLFEHREERIHPLKDDKVLTAWNGLMIAALSMGARVLGDDAYYQAAQAAARFVLGEMSGPGGRLARRWREGQVAGTGFLEDYAFMAWGLIELYQAGFDPWALEEALRLSRLAVDMFGDERHGGFFFTASDSEELVIRGKEAYDGAIPSGNSVMALNLLRLARLTGDTSLEEAGNAVLAAFAAKVARAPIAYTFLLSALDFGLGPASEVVLVGKPGDPRLDSLLNVLRQGLRPRQVVLLKPGGQDDARLAELAPYSAEMTDMDGGPAAYVCQNFACQRPVNDPRALADLCAS